MAYSFNIRVFHGLDTKVFKCSKRVEFLSQVMKCYHINRQDLKMINKETKEEITINDLTDNMEVEVKRKNQNNELRLESSDIEAPVKVPNLEDLASKLRNNTVLTGLERKFILANLHIYENNLHPSGINKRKHEGESPKTVNKKLQTEVAEHLKQFKCTETQTDINKGKYEDECPKTANKKVQVDLKEQLKQLKFKCTQTQTDYMNLESPSTGSSTSRDLNYESKRLALKDKKDPKMAAEMMKLSFDDRRKFILFKNPVVLQIKEKFPLLFDLQQVRSEINNIFYDGKDVEFIENIEKYSSVILSLVDDDDPLLETVKDKVKSVHTTVQKNYVREVGALLMISNLLKEKRLFLNTEDEPCPSNNYPRIEAPCKVNKLFYDLHLYKIIVEGLVLCEATNFKEAILCLMASFFIFNIAYPDSVYNTLVVMEKIFLEAVDTNGNDIDDPTQQIIKLIQLKTNANL